MASAFIATAFAQETPEAASTQWRAVADPIRPRVPKLAAILEDAEHDVLAYNALYVPPPVTEPDALERFMHEEESRLPALIKAESR